MDNNGYTFSRFDNNMDMFLSTVAKIVSTIIFYDTNEVRLRILIISLFIYIVSVWLFNL